MNADPTRTHLNVTIMSFRQLMDTDIDEWLDEQRNEREQQNREVMRDNDWLSDDWQQYPADLEQARRREYVSRVHELTAEAYGEYDRLPSCEFGSAAWFAGIPEEEI
jgi:hypothetical protein